MNTMTSLVVISFTNQAAALEGAKKISKMESKGELTIYEKVVVVKMPDGDIQVLDSDTSDGLHLLSGMTLGTIAGAFAGPVGLAIGLVSGLLLGGIVETEYSDFAEDFKTKTYSRLKPGEAAVILEVYEEGPAFLDNAVESMSATIARSNVDYVHEEYEDEQIEAIEEKINVERKKIKSADAEAKAKIGQKISQLKEKRKKRIFELKEKRKSVIAKIKGKVENERKSRLLNRIYNYHAKIGELEEKLQKLEHSKQ